MFASHLEIFVLLNYIITYSLFSTLHYEFIIQHMFYSNWKPNNLFVFSTDKFWQWPFRIGMELILLCGTAEWHVSTKKGEANNDPDRWNCCSKNERYLINRCLQWKQQGYNIISEAYGYCLRWTELFLKCHLYMIVYLLFWVT